MKLPQSKKERQQLLIVVGIVIVGIMYAVWTFVYQPILAKRSEAAVQTKALEDQIAGAEAQIRRIPMLERDLHNLVTNLLEISERQMLQAQLGNYLISAREILNRQARSLNILTVQIDEVGLVPMPRPKDKGRPKPRPAEEGSAPAQAATPAAPAGPPPATIQAYTVRVTTACGYHDLRRWIKLLEEEYAYAAINSIMITARPENAMEHQITFEVQWPVWVDQEMRVQLQEKADPTQKEGEET